MISYEQPFWKKNELVLGIDEAGRGPLAGPLVVAGVVLNQDDLNFDITDSKKISEKKRNQLFEWILENALWTKILVIDEKTIDQENIYQATKNGMKQIALSIEVSCVLSDAMPFELENTEVISLIKGDQKSLSIAAASILAKVTRDEIMKEYDKLYPKYGFARHKGYPTKAHYEAIKEYGVLGIHRLSYKLFRD
ncbi:MAG TPA: ribonuclease HII [Erysipelothrix sp.]|jgi:ribonuclease HII|nr:ribonuclease HII [Erysipelothrix sp.]